MPWNNCVDYFWTPLISAIIFFEYKTEHNVLDIVHLHTDLTPVLVRNSTLLHMQAPRNGEHCLTAEEHGAKGMLTTASEDKKSYSFWTWEHIRTLQMNPSKVHSLPRNFTLFRGWFLTSFSRFDKEYVPFANIATLFIFTTLSFNLQTNRDLSRCTLLLIFCCVRNSKLDAKLRIYFFRRLASLSACRGMMFSLIEYLIAYPLVWVLSRMFWKSMWKQADNFHLSHICWRAQRVLIDWSGFANALPESLLYLRLSDILLFQPCFHRR